MSPLSKELSRIVQPHDSFGTHLNDNGKSISNVKELKNFKKACKLLSEIRSEMTTSGNQFSDKWVDPSVEIKAYDCFTDSKICENWLETRVFISRYCLQIAKRNNLEYCQPEHTNLQKVLRGKFQPTLLTHCGGPYFINPSNSKQMKHKILAGFTRTLHCSSCDQRVTRNK